eukprot:TRINITY_DN3516_c0_g1_i2.p1 TRINITY_DN3516_c0_g1~~TRINITY_DN3516_c0_g1_i2.p1  ORF type:complete len:141 (+),score=46.85 TRINITY_DN3516_c0_g1_i2:52-474(+)
MTCYLRTVTKCGYKGGIAFGESGEAPEPVQERAQMAKERALTRVDEVEEFERLHEADQSVYLQKLKVAKREKEKKEEQRKQEEAEAEAAAVAVQQTEEARARRVQHQKQRFTDKYGDCFVWSHDIKPKDTLSRQNLNASI